MVISYLLWAGLLLFAVLAFNVRRTIKARDISGVIVMGDVYGDINQQQAPQSPPTKIHLWKSLLTVTNALLGIVAAALVIGSQIME